MRSFLASLLMTVTPAALFAAPVETPAKVTSVILFPQGAQVTRIATVEGGQVLIPDLPDGTDISTLRVTGDGVAVGAVTLIDDRQPVAGQPDSPAVAEARARVETLEQALAEKTDAIAQMRAGAGAARARADVLRGASTQNTPLAELENLARTVGEGVRAAEQEALTIEAQVRDADAALKPDREALEQARQALAALEHPAKGSDTLLVEASGAGTLTITTFVADAGWSPAYDLRLDSGAGALALDRLVSVRQAAGEDWLGVDLTLSTARPSDRTDPSEIWPEQVRFGPPDAPRPMAEATGFRKADMAVLADAAVPEMQGETLTYRYPAAVDIRDGVEGLRLKLDTIDRPVSLRAEAVPLVDTTAYRMVEGTAGDEPLLPGPAALFVDGAMVGSAHLPMIAAGAEFRLGFGAIDGLTLKRVIPGASEGGRGLISRSNARVETVRITVENLTPRDWPLRVLDRVPYSEQDDLKVTYKADPAPTATDWKDKRGVLAWEFDLPAGGNRDITVETTLNWPAGQVLQ
ncbi:DUF4139 domain-containing protein [Paenirhodobacter populi]|uniref:DUF4139 domain-containing protein n=1 Tax=Paenirhodobacter populi TaxID=2306993 RepID=UPI000FE37B1A|nr:DUF4139 domain-containing protein [Sinirhodobacter populi]RWR11560.1 mucoidy inhibitor MuiA family protein [Sinirhodobacter populi]